MGKVTKIKRQEKNKNRVNVFVDDSFAFGLSEMLLVDFNIFVGKELNPETITEIMNGESYSQTLNRAYRLLSFRSRSESELTAKLMEKSDSKIVEKVIQKLKEYNLVNDIEFSKMWINERKANRGKKALEFELVKKGINKEIIEAITSELDPEAEFKTALLLAKRKYKTISKDEAYKKVAPFLSRRGFTYDVIKKVIENITK